MTTHSKLPDDNNKNLPDKAIKQKMIPPQPKGFNKGIQTKPTIRRNAGRGR